MKRKIVVLFAVVLLACLCVGLCSCKNFNAQSIMISCKDAKADGYNIRMNVTSSTERVDLSQKIVAHLGFNWKIYSDEELWFEVDRTVYLQDGVNRYYVAAITAFGDVAAVYTLTIVRNYKATITYYANGNVIKTDETFVNQQYTVDETLIPQIDGYEFEYWADENGQKVTSFALDGDVTLTAKFKAVTYYATVSDTEESESSTKVEYGKPFTLPIKTDGAKVGFEFDGWSYNGQRLTDKYGESVVNWNIANNVTLTPIWAAHQYNVTLNCTNEYYTVNGAGLHGCEQNVTITQVAPTSVSSYDIGVIWLGWYDENDTRVTTNLSYTFKMPAKNVTFTAKWAKCSPIYIPEQGGNITASSIVLTAGTNVVFTAKDFTLESWGREDRHTFVGWCDEEGNIISTSRTRTITIPDGDLTVYAAWTTYHYSFIYLDVDTNEQQKINTVDKRAGVKFTYPQSTYTDRLRDIVGFYDEEDNLITTDREFEFTMQARDYNVYVKYRQYTVTLLPEEGIDAGSVNLWSISEQTSATTGIAAYDSNVRCMAYSTLGYIFNGWYNGDELVCSNRSYEFTMPRENLVLAARWLPNKVNIESENIELKDITLNDHYLTDGMVTLYPSSKVGTWVGWYNGDTLITREYELEIDPTLENITYTAKRVYSPVKAQRETETGIANASYCAVIGDECTLTFTPYLGYDFVGWYENDEFVTTDLTFKVISSEVMRTFVAKTKLKAEMEGVEFSSSTTYCTVTGVKDKTITELTIANCVTKIDDNAFKDCVNLTSLAVSVTVTSIGEYAFSGCTSLTELTYKGSESSWNNISKDYYWSRGSSLQIVRCADGVEIAVPKDSGSSSGRI